MRKPPKKSGAPLPPEHVSEATVSTGRCGYMLLNPPQLEEVYTLSWPKKLNILRKSKVKKMDPRWTIRWGSINRWVWNIEDDKNKNMSDGGLRSPARFRKRFSRQICHPSRSMPLYPSPNSRAQDRRHSHQAFQRTSQKVSEEINALNAQRV